ncbi:CC_3452 family protein [Sphingomonas sp.]|uniref:CC_3452 family protein n=1 Tax=Sphingomonas sp. TaxID=28214 RepID=UPI003AFF989B
MTRTTFAAVAVIAMLGQAAIAAEPVPVRATLTAPLAAPLRVSSSAATWTCTGVSCTGPASNARLGDARGCRELAKAAGAVASYSGAGGEMAAEDLAKCNKAAKPAV